MKPIKCIIVDDEKLAREGIAHLLKSEKDFEIIDQCKNGSEAITSVTHYQPEVLFLDIKMPDMNGFEVLRSLKEHSPPIIVFITAYDKFALEAFEACALDYLLKPFDDDRFYKVLNRIRKHAQLHNSKPSGPDITKIISKFEELVNAENNDKKYLDRIMVKRDGGVNFIRTRDIMCFEAADYYVKIITEKEEYLIRKSLNGFEEKVNPTEFIRIHRGTLVNVSAIDKIEFYSNDEYIAELRNGKKYRISKAGKKKLDERFRI